MLVLNRKSSESIIIGNSTVTILHVKGGYVKLGIVAPKDVKILRSELKGKAA